MHFFRGNLITSKRKEITDAIYIYRPYTACVLSIHRMLDPSRLTAALKSLVYRV
jgi:hypothetical protein